MISIKRDNLNVTIANIITKLDLTSQLNFLFIRNDIKKLFILINDTILITTKNIKQKIKIINKSFIILFIIIYIV